MSGWNTPTQKIDLIPVEEALRRWHKSSCENEMERRDAPKHVNGTALFVSMGLRSPKKSMERTDEQSQESMFKNNPSEISWN